jgi:hypothetical protein
MKRTRLSSLYFVGIAVLLSTPWDAAGFVDNDSGRASAVTRIRLSSASNAASEPQHGSDTPSSSSGCPFSMAFPRYRIDLSSEKNARKRFGAVKSGVGLLSSIKQGFDKAAIERRYAKEGRDGCLVFVDCSVDTNALEKAKGGDCPAEQRSSHKVSDDEWKSGLAGLRAASQYWNIVANIAEADVSTAWPTQRTVVSFIGATPLQIQRLIDIESWLDENMTGDHSHLRIDADGEMPIPTIVIESRATKGNDEAPGESPREDLPSADVIEERIKAWVRRILVQLSICPFTKSDTRSGQGLSEFSIPTGCISYQYSKAGPSNIPRLMADCWASILQMVEAGPGGKRGISSILLSAPLFDDDFPLWSGPVFTMLEAGVGAAGAEPIIGVVCFHPRYATPDGSSWPGFGHMHSVPRLRKWVDEQDPRLSEKLSDDQIAAGGAWQRRTPHAVLNVLRANQLEAAESRRQSPQMYSRNIRVLVAGNEDGGIGSDKLTEDLEMERSLSKQARSTPAM